MQSKGKLGSILAGVIAVLLVLVCAFYLSFTFVNNKYENEAGRIAKEAVEAYDGPATDGDSIYSEAYKVYMDSVGEEKVYLGWALNDVKKWGVNLGLDLKGGMSVILQVDLGDIIRQSSTDPNDPLLIKAAEETNKYIAANKDEDYVVEFLKNLKSLSPGVNFAARFTPVTQNHANDIAGAAADLKRKSMA